MKNPRRLLKEEKGHLKLLVAAFTNHAAATPTEGIPIPRPWHETHKPRIVTEQHLAAAGVRRVP